MTSTNEQFNAQYNLDQNQQGLLLAALNFNNPPASRNNTPKTTPKHNLNQSAHDMSQDMSQQFNFEGMDSALFMNGQSSMPMSNFETPLGESPYLDFLDNNDPNYDGNFDFDLPETDGQMIGAMPGSEDGSQDIHDKRKMSEDDDEDDDEHENGAKRQETGEGKTAKKPGRKPLTSEPTSKRKAQNRAAQRAFRERKEKHLKDLETKVGELEKASDSANHENGLLRAQVERLQIELREYRKRLSMNSSGMLGRGTPASVSLGNSSSTSTSGTQNTFSFDFPRFGSLPTGFAGAKAASPPVAKISSNNAPGVLARKDSNGTANGRSISPRLPSVTSPTKSTSISSAKGPNENLMNLFSPGMLNGLGTGGLNHDGFVNTTMTVEPQSIKGSTNQNSPSRIFQFNSSNTSASPDSSSSVSQYGGPNSSCGTSPEPSHNSPGCAMNTINEDGTTGEVTFCEKLNMACGNIRDPIPRTKSQSNGTPGAAPANDMPTPTSMNNGNANANTNTSSSSSNQPIKNFDWFATQNGGQFDPVLFGDYRDPQTAIVGDGDFTGGFFNDAMAPSMDFTSPFNWADLTAPTGLTPAVQKTNPMDQADALLAGVDEDEVVPGEDQSSLLSCHKIWDKLQDRPDFKDGSLDIDGLCSELRAKARCSESGVVIDQKDVDAALKGLPAKRQEHSPPSLPGM
ncbi:bzip transcription factor (ap-1) [Venturia nashicola]|nr:bzip transcription factor (ap-1) [Venturia nashicola]